MFTRQCSHALFSHDLYFHTSSHHLTQPIILQELYFGAVLTYMYLVLG